jgi:signal transduction histidine kinase
MTTPEPTPGDARRRAIDAACARHSIEHSHVTVFSSAVILVVCHLLFRGHVPKGRLLAWTALVTTMILVRAGVAWGYRRRVPDDAGLGAWVVALALTMTSSSLAWGSLVFVPDAPDSGLSMTVAIVFAGGGRRGGADARRHAPDVRGRDRRTPRPLLVFLARSGVREHAFLAAATIVFLVFVVHVALQNRRLLRGSIALKFGNLDLVERLTEEKARAEEARRTAEQATTTKDQFLAAASHDIRQPIHAAFMFLGAIEDGSPSTLEQPVAGLRTSLVAARQMLDGLLDVSKIDAGVVDRVDVPCHAATFAARVAAIMQPVANRRGLELRTWAPADLWFEADPVLCQSIVMNLTSNGLKYTSRGPSSCRFEGRASAAASRSGTPASASPPPSSSASSTTSTSSTTPSAIARAGSGSGSRSPGGSPASSTRASRCDRSSAAGACSRSTSLARPRSCPTSRRRRRSSRRRRRVCSSSTTTS